MSKEPTFWSSLREHGEIALRLRGLKLDFDPAKCTGVWQCIEVCPVDCWAADHDRGKAVLERPESCIACSACVLQCPERAVELR